MPKTVRCILSVGCVLLMTTPLRAQRGGGDWVTVGSDGQRSSWVRGDAKISFETMVKPGFQLVWELNLLNEARQLNSLTSPALFDFYIGYRGFRSLGFVGGSSGQVTAIDVDLARIEWERSLQSDSAPGESVDCPGGMTAGVTRPTFAGYPAARSGARGRGTPAKSGVGEPFEGAVTLKERSLRTPPPSPPAPGARTRTAPQPNPFTPTVQYAHAISADGKLHSLYVSNGEEPDPPIPFLPPNANALGLIVFDNTAYVATVNGCGGVGDGIWALDLASRKVSHWKSSSGVAGSAGFAVGPDGVLYVATVGGDLVALEPGTLTVKGSHRAGLAFSSSPLVFDHQGRDLIAAAMSDGRIRLLDSSNLDQAPLAVTPVFSVPDYAVGSLAGWQDSTGTQWLLAPAGGPIPSEAGFGSDNGEVKNGSIAAFKLVAENGVHVLQPGWVSRDMVAPLTPAVVNGVLFALSSGEFRTADPGLTAAQRAQRSSNAILYALNPFTGKELWNSGSTITSFVHSGGLAAGGGRVYVAGHNGTQYAFGFPMEH